MSDADEAADLAREQALHAEVFDSSMTDYEYFLKRKDQLTMDDQCKTADGAIEEQTRLGAWAAHQAIRNGELEAKQKGLDQGVLMLESLWENLSKNRKYALAGYVRHVIDTLEGKAE